MIRKLRWKFSAIMMTIVAFLLAVIFITLYYTTKANYVQRSMGTLHSAMLENYPGSMRHINPSIHDIQEMIKMQAAFDGHRRY